MALLGVFLLLMLVVPFSVYEAHRGGRGPAWGLVAAGREQRGRGVYRGTRSTLWTPGSAPLAVRLAALSSFFLGQMIVPGALAAVVGVLLGG